MEFFITNRIGRVRQAIVNGRKYFIAPMTIIVPGVLNGSKGALYYPPEEISKNVHAWNHIPITVNHPISDNGQNLSAKDPGVLAKQGIGFLLNTRWKNKLQTDGWFDYEKTKAKSPRIYEALKRGESMELSTGLFTVNHPAAPGATYNGKRYEYIAKQYTPDHLAILPDQIGACSRNDGCGLNLNHNIWKRLEKLMSAVQNEWSDAARQAAIEARRASAKAQSPQQAQKGVADHRAQAEHHIAEYGRLKQEGKHEEAKQHKEAYRFHQQAEKEAASRGEAKAAEYKAGGEQHLATRRGSKEDQELAQKSYDADAAHAKGQAGSDKAHAETAKAYREAADRHEKAGNTALAKQHRETADYHEKASKLSPSAAKAQIDEVRERSRQELEKARAGKPTKNERGSNMKQKGLLKRLWSIFNSTPEQSAPAAVVVNPPTKEKKEEKPIQAAASGSAEAASRVAETQQKVANDTSLAHTGSTPKTGTVATPLPAKKPKAAPTPRGATGGTPAAAPAPAPSPHAPESGATDQAGATSSNDPEEVENHVINKLKGVNMDRTEAIEYLVTNCACWKEEKDREVLNTLSDTKIASLTEQAIVSNAVQKNFGDLSPNTVTNIGKAAQVFNAFGEAEEEDDSELEEPIPPLKKKKGFMTENEWLEAAPPKIQSVVRNAMANEEKERVSLLNRLTANCKDQQHKQRVTNKHKDIDIQDLRDLVAALPTPKKKVTRNEEYDNYAGASAGTGIVDNTTSNNADDVLPLPTINYAEKVS